MDSFQEQKQRMLRLIGAAAGFADRHKQEAVRRRLGEAADRLSQGKLLVVVCGEFKQGKSSLINALLGERGLFPVDVDITTSVVTTIAYAPEEKVTVITGEAGKEKSAQIARGEIADYVTEQRNRNNARQARLLIIEAPNDKLRDGLVIADTPGIGSLNVHHTDVTYSYVPNADAVVFVSDALAPMSEAELKFVEMIARHCAEVIYVVTKVDAVQNYQAIIDSNREKLSSTLGRPGAEIPIIPVSSANKLAYLDSGDEDDLEDSNFARFEGELWRLLSERRGSILLLRAVGELGRSLAEMKNPLLVELEACQSLSKKELDELEERFRAARDKHQALLDSDVWRVQLQRGLTDIRTSASERLQEGFTAVRRHGEEFLGDAALLESPEQIAGLLEVEIDALVTTLGGHLSRQAANLHGQIELASGLDLNPYEVGGLERDRAEVASAEARAERIGPWEKAVTVTRSAMFASTPGATVGAVIGGTIGAAVGFLFGGVGAGPGAAIGASIGSSIGGVAGLKTGARQGLTQIREKETAVAREKAARIVRPYLDDSYRLCQKSLGKALTGLEHAMQDELLSQIRREKRTLEATLESVKSSRKLTQEQAAQRAAELQSRVRQLEEIQGAMDDVARLASAPALGEGRPAARLGAPAASLSAPQAEPAAAFGWDSE